MLEKKPAGTEQPAKVEPEKPQPEKADKAAPPEAAEQIAERPAEMPDEEKACRLRLTQLGVVFAERPQLRDPAGCSVPWPLALTRLSAAIAIEPEAVLNCRAAEAIARFAADEIAPGAQRILNRTLTAIRQDSAYVCRPRNGTTKLSEHAFGNAIDIGALKFSQGEPVEVGASGRREEAELLLKLRLKACGPFKTVLGPGSDADHARHFHFDLAERRGGSTFCQ